MRGSGAWRYWRSVRPGFLPVSVLPIVVGTAWGRAASGSLDAHAALLAMLAVVPVHAAANVLNDVADADGSDASNEARIAPYSGGSRVIQEGLLTRGQMRRWGTTLLAIAILPGLLLTAQVGTAVLGFGLAGVLLGLLYSLPPASLAGRGWGELTIALAFGVLPVTGAAWLQSGVVDLGTLLVSLPVALWVAAIIVINEVPDAAADAAAGKRTLPVRLGTTGTRRLYLSLQLAALAALASAVAARLLVAPALLAVPVLGAVAIGAGHALASGTGDRAALRRAIERTLAIHALGCLWLAAAAWLSR